MQSEEEIINNIKTMLEKNDEIFDEVGTDLYFSKSTAEVIQGLLDLYNKEKEEKEKFKKALGKRITYCNELEKDLFENGSNYVISKDKIREFIKNETFEGTYSFDLISAKRLKELLEE